MLKYGFVLMAVFWAVTALIAVFLGKKAAGSLLDGVAWKQFPKEG